MEEQLRRGLSQVFWNDDQRRPRAPIRFAVSLLFILLFVFLLGVVTVVVGLGIGSLGPLATAVAETLSVSALVVAVLGAVWIVDRRRFRDIGLGIDSAWRRQFAVGLGLGAIMVTFVAAVVVLTVGSVAGTTIRRDGALFVGLSVPIGLVVAAGYFLAIGILEELIFRGYVLVNIAEGARIALDSRRAVLLGLGVSAALFGTAHASNPNATALSTLNIALFGLLLGGGYVSTDSLAVPIGIHTGWNFVLGPVFGFPVSGLTTGVAVVAIDYDSSSALAGGGFGPEGGVLALAALLVGTAMLALWLRYTGGLSIREQIAEPELWTRS